MAKQKIQLMSDLAEFTCKLKNKNEMQMVAHNGYCYSLHFIFRLRVRVYS